MISVLPHDNRLCCGRFYLTVRDEASKKLTDGTGHKPHYRLVAFPLPPSPPLPLPLDLHHCVVLSRFYGNPWCSCHHSLRTLCRALKYAAGNPHGNTLRSLYEVSSIGVRLFVCQTIVRVLSQSFCLTFVHPLSVFCPRASALRLFTCCPCSAPELLPCLCSPVLHVLSQGFCLSFLTQLDRSSHPVVKAMVAQHILGHVNANAVLKQPLPRPQAPGPEHFCAVWRLLGCHGRPESRGVPWVRADAIREGEPAGPGAGRGRPVSLDSSQQTYSDSVAIAWNVGLVLRTWWWCAHEIHSVWSVPMRWWHIHFSFQSLRKLMTSLATEWWELPTKFLVLVAKRWLYFFKFNSSPDVSYHLV